MVMKQLADLQQRGQKVIACVYGPINTQARTGYVTFHYWYQSAPPEILKMLTSAFPHPFMNLGRVAVTACPATKASPTSSRPADSTDEASGLFPDRRPICALTTPARIGHIQCREDSQWLDRVDQHPAAFFKAGDVVGSEHTVLFVHGHFTPVLDDDVSRRSILVVKEGRIRPRFRP